MLRNGLTSVKKFCAAGVNNEQIIKAFTSIKKEKGRKTA
jgi:hypothetical protein